MNGCLTTFLGWKFHIHTDHKTLVPLFSTKHLEELPIRVQRFHLRMMQYHFTISHVPGKDLIIAEALSRAPTTEATKCNQLLQKEADCFVNAVMESLPATETQLQRIRLNQEECQKLVSYIKSGWPRKHHLPAAIHPYHSVASEILVQQGLLI